MFTIINTDHEKELERIVEKINHSPIQESAKKLTALIYRIREDIPIKKRISYGKYTIIKKMGFIIYPLLQQYKINPYAFSTKVVENKDFDQFLRSLGIQIISIYGKETGELKRILPIFEKAAADDYWELRECSAGFIRKLIKTYPNEMKKWYKKIVKSNDPRLRRFASESIRPVADNKWFKKRPDFCFSILKNLYHESHNYARTSVGNNLSDWSKIEKERVFKIIEQLVKENDKNSYWIAYRACRNLIKTEPNRVLDLLGIDEYKYKKNIYHRKKLSK